ncbi:hypothetical protein BP6252_09055 [Coleophoma cylindrospora]|uniref:Ornithine cyclodeaminase n=1 Tax=Coleophoma cylindrospora TaxID=1849047 RepID=A0A3D8R0U7_9HELO|nr:hypothetical protein BP6252_09055 [Coleophoma cylindrospora]
MDFLLLTDSAVKQLLAGLEGKDVKTFANSLRQAFLEYSTQNEHLYQPHRIAVTRPGGQASLFMPATSSHNVAVKIVGAPPPQAASTALRCVLTLCDATGQARGILNAEELTAFRTSMGSMLLFENRRVTTNIVVFGAGKQALWHIRLALLLRGADIQKITVVNRSLARSDELLDRLSKDDQSHWHSQVQFDVLDPSRADYQPALERLLVESDVIFCTTPSRVPLFSGDLLFTEQARAKTRYIAAIGSWNLEMAELHPDMLRQVVDDSDGYNPKGDSGGVIAVDSREACYQEAGEIVQAGIEPDKIIEVGEIVDLLASGKDAQKMNQWLESGLVVYKSVGLGIMDIAIGEGIMALARQKGLGVSIPDF